LSYVDVKILVDEMAQVKKYHLEKDPNLIVEVLTLFGEQVKLVVVVLAV
jgi:hypothetical protein